MNSLTDLIEQYEAEAERIAKKTVSIRLKMKSGCDSTTRYRLWKLLIVLNNEYHEITSAIHAMKKYEGD